MNLTTAEVADLYSAPFNECMIMLTTLCVTSICVCIMYWLQQQAYNLMMQFLQSHLHNSTTHWKLSAGPCMKPVTALTVSMRTL